MICDQFIGARLVQLMDDMNDGHQRLIFLKLLDFQCRLLKAGGA